MLKADLLKTVKQKRSVRINNEHIFDLYFPVINHFSNWLINRKIT